MWRTRARLVSSAWRPHAALLQGWLAGSGENAQQLAQARAYLYELNVEDALVDADDAAELLQLMHRAAYPAGSRLEARVSAFLLGSGNSSGLSAGLVARQLRAEPAAGALWARVALSQLPLATRLAHQLAHLPIAAHVECAAAQIAALRGDPAGGPAAAQIAEHTARRIALISADETKEEGVCAALVLCARARFPLHDAALAPLRDVLYARTRADVRGASSVAELATALSTPQDSGSSSSSSNGSGSGAAESGAVDSAWVVALCDAAARTPLTGDAASALLHAMALAATRAAPCHAGDAEDYAQDDAYEEEDEEGEAAGEKENAETDAALDARLAAAAPALPVGAVLNACAAVAAVGPSRLPALRSALRSALEASPGPSPQEGGGAVGEGAMAAKKSKTKAKSKDAAATRLWRLRGAALLDAAEAAALLDAEAAMGPAAGEDVREDIRIDCAGAARLARCMCAAEHFPAALCRRCVRAVSDDSAGGGGGLAALSPDDCAFVLLAAARSGDGSGGGADSPVCAALIARVGGAQRAFRGAAALSSPRAAAAVLDAVAEFAPDDRARLLAVGSRLRGALARVLSAGASQRPISPKCAVARLRRVAAAVVPTNNNSGNSTNNNSGNSTNNNSGNSSGSGSSPADDLSAALLASVARRVDALSAADAAAACDVLVALRSRDALLFRALVARLAALSPGREGIVSAACAARQLRLVPHFASAGLTARLESLDGWAADEFVCVLAASSRAERERLSALPGAAQLLDADPAALSARDAFLRVSVAVGPEDAKRAAAALRPVTAGDVSAEEVRRALHRCAGDAEAVAQVCRSAAAALCAADEHELMRLLDAVADAPKLPNAFFRVVGFAVRRVAGGMTAVNALRWLQFYMRHDVRDDGVGRALILRARIRSTKSGPSMDRALREASAFFGRAFTEQRKAKGFEERVPWYGDKPKEV